MTGFIVCIVVLLAVVISLIVYNISIYKKVKNLSNTSEKIANLRILQDFMDTIGKDASAENKIKIINDILIEKYHVKYSTIVVFNGAEYKMKATNVDERQWETMTNLHTDPLFQSSIINATPKYVTVNNNNEKLSYQKNEMTRAKSAMFFPLYIDNVYIGYWIIESGRMHAFDNVDTTILEVVKENIISVFRIVTYQNIIESLKRKDLYSDLQTSEYLYEEGRKVIDKYTTSTICMFKITNLEETNKKINRDTGNQMIIDVCDYIKDKLSDEYLFVRYMGPKFAIAFSGIEIEGVVEFLDDLKKEVEALEIEDVVAEEQNEKSKKTRKKKIVTTNPKLNFVLTTYYKGTALEAVLKKLEEYLDSANADEHDINKI